MNRVRSVGNCWVLTGDEGTTTLWDTGDVFANRSAVGLFGLLNERGECRAEDSFMARLAKRLGLLGDSPQETAYQAVVLLALKELLGKYRPHRFLLLGAAPESLLAEILASMMAEFHPGNRLVCVTEPSLRGGDHTPRRGEESFAAGEANGETTASWQMRYEDLLLPTQAFDVAVVVGDDARPFPAVLWPRVAESVRLLGRLLVISREAAGEKFCCDILGGERWPIGEDLSLYTVTVSSTVVSRARELKPYRDKEQLKPYLRQTIEEIAPVMDAADGPANAQPYIALIAEAEEVVLLIYDTLRSVDIKYWLNRLKEALIEYHLQIGSWMAVKESYRKVREELRGEV